MKNLILLFFGILNIGCSSDDENNSINEKNITYLKYSLRLENDPTEIIFILEYAFDDNGKVVSESYTNINNPQYSGFSRFIYNNKGRVIQEIREGEVVFNINWTDDLAEVYNNQNQKISEFNFNGDMLTGYKTRINSNYPRIKNLNYNSSQNIVSIENGTEIYVEFLDYDLTKRNPMNLIESIGILRIDYKPYFKNIFGTEKAYPYQADDYSKALTFYKYSYRFNSENRVYQIQNEKTRAYIQQFEYK